MEDKEFVLKDFKEYLPLDVDSTDKERLVYRPILVSTELKKKIEPSLTEEQLYIHMKENSKWIFMFKDDVEYFKQDCIDFLRDIDFQSFSQYGKLTERNYRSAKTAYLFDSYLRNFLQELLERIEVFLKNQLLMQLQSATMVIFTYLIMIVFTIQISKSIVLQAQNVQN